MSTKSECLRIRGELQSRREVIAGLKKALESARKSRLARLKACRAERLERSRAVAERAKVARRKLKEHITRAKKGARVICSSCAGVSRESLKEIDAAYEFRRFAPERLAPERSARESSAPERLAPERSARERLAPERSARERLAPERLAPERSARERLAR